MEPRMDPYSAAPEAVKAMLGFEEGAKRGLEPTLVELVKTRASQINGCAFCLHMHTRDARAAGESEERLYLLSAWRESPLYTERERAALAWTDALTRVAEAHPSDALFQEVRQQFTDKELVHLTFAIGAINVWNRFAIGFGAVHPHESRDVAE